jgi:hypothetical protein
LVRSPPFQGGRPGSSPGRDANLQESNILEINSKFLAKVIEKKIEKMLRKEIKKFRKDTKALKALHAEQATKQGE